MTRMCSHLFYVDDAMGVQNWDGSGGNGAAMRHFEATGQKYPLVVKLGTITANGADVYSYASDESDMVEDPDLVCAPHTDPPRLESQDLSSGRIIFWIGPLLP